MKKDTDIVDKILSGVTSARKGSAWERWLDGNPEAADVFWEIMKRGYVENSGRFAPLFRSYRKHFPDSPSVQMQKVKNIVDAHFSEG